MNAINHTFICARCKKPSAGEIIAIRRFMRHGKTQMNIENICNGSIDEPMNTLGKEQAREAAERFSLLGEKIDAIVTSPMKRAKQTARIFAAKLNFPEIRTEYRLRERCVGEIEGKPETPESEAQLYRYDYLPKGATPLEEFEKETADFLRDCATSHFPASTLFITHGFRMLTLIKLIKAMSVLEIMRYTPPANCQMAVFGLDPTCSCGSKFYEKIQ